MAVLNGMEMSGATWKDIIRNLLETMDNVTEIETNGTTSLFYKQAGKRKEVVNVYEDEDDYVSKMEELIDLVKSEEEKQINPDSKFLVEGRLKLTTGETARVHIVMPPAADTPQVTIAKKSNTLATLEEIQAKGSMSSTMLDYIKAAVDCNMTIILSGGTGAGKALHKDTPIPTPTGFKTVEELNVGDIIFDEKGEETKIEVKYSPNDPISYELTFNNGEKVKASAGHLWKVNYNGNEEIFETDKLKSIYNEVSIDVAENIKDEYSINNDYHYITNIQEVEDNPSDYYCFQVDSPSHLFLCTESFIPTHNTTMLEAMTKLIDPEQRIAVVEDLPELRLIQPNVTYTHSTLWTPGKDKNAIATLSWCVAQVNRARTDKVIIGETRGGEFADFITAANSGMEGSLTTIHANNSRAALQKMTQFMIIGQPQPVRLANEAIASSVHLIIQLGFNDRRENRVLEIVEVSRTLGTNEAASIATQAVFKYNKQFDNWDENGYISEDTREIFERNNYNTKTFRKKSGMGQDKMKSLMDNSSRFGRR